MCALAANEPVVAVFTKNKTNPAYENFRIGADKAAVALGARTRHYVPSKPDDVSEQRNLVQQALTEHPDGILFVPVDDLAMTNAMQQFAEAALPVVTAVSRIVGSSRAFVGSDDEEIGYNIARRLLNEIGERGQIVFVEGIASSPTSRDRMRGFRRALAEAPRVEVLATAPGEYQRNVARHVMAELLERYEKIDGAIAANDVMALGVLDALRERHRSARVVGVNGTAEALREIDSGALVASVDFSTFRIACAAMQALMRSRKGLAVPENIILRAELIDRSNVRQFQEPVAERNCPAWDEVIQRQ